MTSIAYSPVSIQTSSQAAPLPPPWFGQVVLIVVHLRKQGVLDAITQRVRFARRRFGRYEVIDFVAVLFGYAISGERTLEAFYQAVLPWAEFFMALFGRQNLPARSTLSRFLSVLLPGACRSPALRVSRRSAGSPAFATSDRQAGLLIEQAESEWSSTLMARARRPANALCPRPRTTRQRSGA